MRLEESQMLHEQLSQEIIDKGRARITLRRELQKSNEEFQKTKVVKLLPWQFKNINDEIDIIGEEIKNLEEQRSLLERQIGKITGSNGKK